MLAPLMAFETSTTKNLFGKCCYLYISIILLILEVVFQFFLRLIRMVQYSKPWAIAYMRVTNIYINLKLYTHAMDSLLCRCQVYVSCSSISSPIIFVLFCSVDGGHCVVFEVSVKCEDDPSVYFREKGKGAFSIRDQNQGEKDYVPR